MGFRPPVRLSDAMADRHPLCADSVNAQGEKKLHQGQGRGCCLRLFPAVLVEHGALWAEGPKP